MDTENSRMGWVKLYRSLENKWFYKKPAYLLLWVHILIRANHEPRQLMWNGELRMIEAGQFITGRPTLEEETGLKGTTIERILEKFERDGQIGQQKTTKFRLITVKNYQQYQECGQQMDNKRTTNGQQTDTNKNVRIKELKNTVVGDKPHLPPPASKKFEPPTIQEVEAYCLERGNSVNASRWFDFYSAKGWMVGKNKMKDWRAAVRTWEQNSQGGGSRPMSEDEEIKLIKQRLEAKYGTNKNANAHTNPPG